MRSWIGSEGKIENQSDFIQTKDKNLSRWGLILGNLNFK